MSVEFSPSFLHISYFDIDTCCLMMCVLLVHMDQREEVFFQQIPSLHAANMKLLQHISPHLKVYRSGLAFTYYLLLFAGNL